MANSVVIGMQWGDEGKGKIVDLLCPLFDVVARYQGGHNAGHTVKFGDRHFSLHLVPSGILRSGMQCVLGNGMVIAPEAFFAEIENLETLGVDTRERLFVSERAHVILPEQVALDRAREEAAGKSKIGTTVRGIGPCYELKVARFGLRLVDLTSPHLEERLRTQLLRLEPELAALGGGPIDHPMRVADQCRQWADRLKPYRADTTELMNGWLQEGRRVLFEGAQGALLDVDHGTYPYVTSSNAVAAGAAVGCGVPPTAIDGVLGVLKAYTTRVGGGPFVTELTDDTGEYLRQRGNEFGTTTGRPRRCGWLDLVAARYAARLNGVDCIALTKLDVLDTVEEIRVCVGYRYGGRDHATFPASIEAQHEAQPIYETLPGWRQDTVGSLDFTDLPRAAVDYVRFIEERLETPVGLVSTGPRREETIIRPLEALDRLCSGQITTLLAAN